MPVVLWDIDGTLVRSRGARVSTRAFVRALRQVAHLPDELVYPTDAGGKTDAQIAREMLVALAVKDAHAPEFLARFGAAYLGELERDPALLADDLLVLPGVPAILDRLRAAGVPQSLLTGNLEPVARLKLACVGLDHYFAFEWGAYGSDHADRTCLVPMSRARIRAATGREPDQVVVIGDTPRDIACARAGSARAVAVATGTYSRDELLAHGPDAVLDDLQNTQAALEALLQYSTHTAAPIV